MSVDELCVGSSATVRTAMRRLDAAGKRIVFLADDGLLRAVLTDGDIRRFLLGGGSLDAPAIEAGNAAPHTASDAEEARAMLRGTGYTAVPVVDGRGRIVDVVLPEASAPVEHPSLGIPVVVMAGGRGTRLAPYTNILPKPLIPVGDKPIIEHIMDAFGRYGCTSFHVVVNHKRQLIKAYFAECGTPRDIAWYDEERPLGTGGGLSLLRGRMDGTFFLTNCDVVILGDYADMLRFHRTRGNLVTMVCAYKNVTIPYGVVEMGTQGEISAMREKPEFSFLTNTGLYLVEPSVLEAVEPDVPVGFPDVVERVRNGGGRVAVYPVNEGDWLDMGQLPELERMRRRLYGE